jgi:ubiquinone/menaquinone biosynthesis C-methylase UbiE
MIKLNLGCGELLIPGFINCDLYNPKADVKCDVKSLPYEDNSVDEIYASHIIEHFDFFEALKVLQEWKRVLKVGGKLVVETPDLLGTCKEFVNASEERRVRLYGQFFATPWIEGQTHKFLYTEAQLRWTLGQLEMKDITRVPALRYIGDEHINLKMTCTKG